MKDPRPNLYGMDREALAAFLQHYGTPAFHADQIYRWLYSKRRFDIGSWTDLPSALRSRIAREAIIDSGKVMPFEDVTVGLRGDIVRRETVTVDAPSAT